MIQLLILIVLIIVFWPIFLPVLIGTVTVVVKFFYDGFTDPDILAVIFTVMGLVFFLHLLCRPKKKTPYKPYRKPKSDRNL